MNFAEAIRFYRKRLNLTQEELAEALNVSRRTIINYEQGLRTPNQAKLLQIAQFLGVHPYELIGDSSQETLAAPSPERFLEYAGLLFAGGDLPDHDQDKVFEALTEIYAAARQRRTHSTSKASSQRARARKMRDASSLSSELL